MALISILSSLLRPRLPDHSVCPEIEKPDILRRRLHETREQLRHLQDRRDRMQQVLHAWDKMENGTLDDHLVCVLIESTLPGADHENDAILGAWTRKQPKTNEEKANMNVKIIASRGCQHRPLIEHEFRDLGIVYEVLYVEDHPEVVAQHAIRHSPNIMVDEEVVFRGQPTEGELRAFFEGRGWHRSND